MLYRTRNRKATTAEFLNQSLDEVCHRSASRSTLTVCCLELFPLLLHVGILCPDSGSVFHISNSYIGKIIDTKLLQFHSLPEKPKRKKRRDRNPIKENGLRSSLTPWAYDWNYEVNQLRGDKEFDWDHLDVPLLDIGEPLDEFNFWENEWAKEKEKRQRQARKKKRRRVLAGPLKVAGRRRVWNKRAGSRQRNIRGQFCSKGDDETRVTSRI